MTPRRRWCARALAIVTLGLAPVIVTDELPTGWALVWLLVCCAVAVLQPGPVPEPVRGAADADYTRMGTSA